MDAIVVRLTMSKPKRKAPEAKVSSVERDSRNLKKGESNYDPALEQLFATSVRSSGPWEILFFILLT